MRRVTDDGQVLPYDLHRTPLTVRQAAELCWGETSDPDEQRRREDVIRQWKRRGHLRSIVDIGGNPVLDDGGRPRFYGIDVLRARAKVETGYRRRRR